MIVVARSGDSGSGRSAETDSRVMDLDGEHGGLHADDDKVGADGVAPTVFVGAIAGSVTDVLEQYRVTTGNCLITPDGDVLPKSIKARQHNPGPQMILSRTSFSVAEATNSAVWPSPNNDSIGAAHCSIGNLHCARYTKTPGRR